MITLAEEKRTAILHGFLCILKGFGLESIEPIEISNETVSEQWNMSGKVLILYPITERPDWFIEVIDPNPGKMEFGLFHKTRPHYLWRLKGEQIVGFKTCQTLQQAVDKVIDAINCDLAIQQLRTEFRPLFEWIIEHYLKPKGYPLLLSGAWEWLKFEVLKKPVYDSRLTMKHIQRIRTHAKELTEFYVQDTKKGQEK